jgi:hypothetical protein
MVTEWVQAGRCPLATAGEIIGDGADIRTMEVVMQTSGMVTITMEADLTKETVLLTEDVLRGTRQWSHQASVL